jgi:aminodeoxyfutalosine synthase
LNTNATLLYGHIETRRDRLVHMDMLRRAQDQALARLGYEGTRGPGSGHWSPGDRRAAESGHLGYTGAEGGDAPEITLTRPGTPLPEHIAFGPTNTGSRIANASSSGYYQTIIPLPFFPDGSDLEHLPGPGGLENLRTLAVSRLMLDNFPHVKAFWIMQTLPMAQLMLQAGADDLDGTVVWYDITKLNHATGPHASARAAAPAAGSESNTATHQQVTTWTLEKAIREAGFEPIERDTLYRRVTREGTRWRTEGPV